jgi:hypothetical protein
MMCPLPTDYGLSGDFYLSGFESSPSRLPVDQHELAGLIAPRPLLLVENDLDFLAPVASFRGMRAARTVWDALGASENMGLSLRGGHSHCQLPETEKVLLEAYLEKFLVGTDVDMETGGVLSTKGWETQSLVNFANWEVPTLV